MLSFETDVDYKEIKTKLYNAKTAKNNNKQAALYWYVCLTCVSVVCVCCLWNVITVRNNVVELQQRMLLLAHKNNSLSKEKYELEMQIPYLHNNNADIQGKLLDIQTYMKALNEEIKETEDRMMHHKKH
jgi:septal ring factor EnvC (AmiA/AmiB activator)